MKRQFLDLHPTNDSSGLVGCVWRWYCPNCHQAMKKINKRWRLTQLNPRYFCEKCNIEWSIV